MGTLTQILRPVVNVVAMQSEPTLQYLILHQIMNSGNVS